MHEYTLHIFHLHLIPRYDEDGQSITMKPTSPSAAELDEVKEIITRA